MEHKNQKQRKNQVKRIPVKPKTHGLAGISAKRDRRHLSKPVSIQVHMPALGKKLDI